MRLGWVRSQKRRLWVRRAVLLASLVLTWRYVLQPTVVSGFSMEPTLYNGDRVLVFKLINGPYPVHRLQRLDIVQCLRPGPGHELIVKRVIGLPGDKVRIVEGDVFVNGTLLREPYKHHVARWDDRAFAVFPDETRNFLLKTAQEMFARNVVDGQLVVPERSYFVLGDNRNVSQDSRSFGLIPQESVLGIVIAVTWSLDPLACQRGPEITSGGCAFRAFRTNRLLIRPL